uniref:RecA-like DNA recombinase n=1 Tax=Micrococcus phage Olihed TaxID=3092209 RepID=A0AAU6R645_9CAUD
MPKATGGTARPTTTDEPIEDIGELAVVKTESRGWTDDLFAAYDETEEHLNVLYWGREGSGKTIDLASATQLGRVLFINAEGGLKKRALLANGVKTENLVVFPRPGQPLTYDTLEQALYRVKSDLMDDPKAWFLVAVDSITELAQAFTDEASDDRFEKGKRKNPTWNPTIGDQFFTDLSDYGTSTKMVRKVVRLMRDLPVHVAITALERRDVDEDTSKVAYGPAVGPALQTSLLGYVDVVLYCKAPDESRDYFRAQTKKVGAARAKDRIGVIPKVLVNPTFPRLLAYNEGTLAEDTDEVQAVLREAPEPAKKAGGTRTRPSRAKSTKTPPKAEETTPEPEDQADDADETSE